ncbi:hypothetical protein Daus18300_002445 [Diaporthe australafricana]|uniref:Uncharacterized protein n=1 Tax=Diaporthe australafricana TaxID=127596 RepID=A0ABR3XNA1_9PEZI
MLDISCDAEKGAPITHPVQSYNLVFPEISRLQNHAFTAAKVGSGTEGPVFLLQRSQGKVSKNLEKEWTWKLGAVVPEVGARRDVQVRVEGPYYPSDVGFTVASKDALADFQLVWTVRYNNTANIREWEELENIVASVPNMSIRVHVSSESGRMDSESCLREMLSNSQGNTTLPDIRHKAWVYVSGPESLLSTTEMACLAVRRSIRDSRKGKDLQPWLVKDLEWYSAKWEV